MGSIGGRMGGILDKKALFKASPLVFQAFLIKLLKNKG